MKMCDRCSQAFSCLLNYNEKACANLRKEKCPEVIYSNADHISEMDEKELANFLAEWNKKQATWRKDSGEVFAWLKEEH